MNNSKSGRSPTPFNLPPSRGLTSEGWQAGERDGKNTMKNDTTQQAKAPLSQSDLLEFIFQIAHQCDSSTFSERVKLRKEAHQLIQEYAEASAPALAEEVARLKAQAGIDAATVGAYSRQIAALKAQNASLYEALKALSEDEWRDDDDPRLTIARSKARAALAQ